MLRVFVGEAQAIGRDALRPLAIERGRECERSRLDAFMIFDAQVVCAGVE
jgi:hypothetical protein